MASVEYSESNIAAVVTGDKLVRLEQWKLPELKPNDVLLSISSVGICGSDIKYWAYGKCGRFSMGGNPMVIGHEAAGVVREVGKDVTHLKCGDRVAIEPGVPCKSCDLCATKRYNLCKEMKFCATPPVHGNLCRFYVHDADFCYKLPYSVGFEEGAMIEPLSVAVHTCRRAGIASGHHVIIFGAGPIGILCGLVAKQFGAEQVLTIDIDEHRLNIAKTFLSCDVTCLISPSGVDPIELAERLRRLGKDDGCHAALECSGADNSLKTAMHVTRPGGSVLLVGRGSHDVSLPMVRAGTLEIDVKGIFRYANTYPEAIELVASGSIDVKKLITHRFTLERSNDAFMTAANPKEKSIKVMINCE